MIPQPVGPETPLNFPRLPLGVVIQQPRMATPTDPCSILLPNIFSDQAVANCASRPLLNGDFQDAGQCEDNLDLSQVQLVEQQLAATATQMDAAAFAVAFTEIDGLGPDILVAATKSKDFPDARGGGRGDDSTDYALQSHYFANLPVISASHDSNDASIAGMGRFADDELLFGCCFLEAGDQQLGVHVGSVECGYMDCLADACSPPISSEAKQAQTCFVPGETRKFNSVFRIEETVRFSPAKY